MAQASRRAFGRPGASRAEIVAAAQAIGAHEFIEALPEGYDTDVRKRCGRLSAGLQIIPTAGGGTKAGAEVVQNEQPLGNFYEHGTRKIRRTKTGAKRGRMPTHAIFAST